MYKVYECDFCHDTLESTEKMAKHELECLFNPKNRSCLTCINHNNFNAPRDTCLRMSDDLTEDEISELETCDGWTFDPKSSKPRNAKRVIYFDFKRPYVCTVMFLGLYLVLSMLLSKAFGRDVGAVLENGVWLTAYTIFFGWIPWFMTRDYQQ